MIVNIIAVIVSYHLSIALRVRAALLLLAVWNSPKISVSAFPKEILLLISSDTRLSPRFKAGCHNIVVYLYLYHYYLYLQLVSRDSTSIIMTTRRDSDLITAMHHLSWNTYSEVLQNRASILCALIQNAVRIDVCVISDAFSRIPFKVDVLILPFKLFHSHKKMFQFKTFPLHNQGPL